MSLARQKVMAFAATKDPARSRKFYTETLGIPLTSDSPHAFELDAGGIRVRIQKVPDFAPHPFTQLGWEVADIEGTITSLVAKGVIFERYGFMEQDALGIWIAPGGAKVAWFKDPDGNTLSLAQIPA